MADKATLDIQRLCELIRHIRQKLKHSRHIGEDFIIIRPTFSIMWTYLILKGSISGLCYCFCVPSIRLFTVRDYEAFESYHKFFVKPSGGLPGPEAAKN